MRSLKKKYGDRAHFLFVYTREPHAGERNFRDVDQPRTYDERVELAMIFAAQANPDTHIVVDKMNGSAQQTFGGRPNMGFMIDTDGKLLVADAWANPDNFERELKKLKIWY